MQYNVFVTQFDPTGNRELPDMAREGRDIEDGPKGEYALQLGKEQVSPHCVGDVEVREAHSDRLVRFAKVFPKNASRKS